MRRVRALVPLFLVVTVAAPRIGGAQDGPAAPDSVVGTAMDTDALPPECASEAIFLRSVIVPKGLDIQVQADAKRAAAVACARRVARTMGTPSADRAAPGVTLRYETTPAGGVVHYEVADAAQRAAFQASLRAGGAEDEAAEASPREVDADAVTAEPQRPTPGGGTDARAPSGAARPGASGPAVPPGVPRGRGEPSRPPEPAHPAGRPGAARGPRAGTPAGEGGRVQTPTGAWPTFKGWPPRRPTDRGQP